MIITIKIKFNDSGLNGRPITGSRVEWKLKEPPFGPLETIRMQGADNTDGSGDLTILNVTLNDGENLALWFKIAGKEGTIRDIKLTFTTKRDSLLQKQQNILITQDQAAGGAIVSLTNPRRLWLTYETRFNWSTFYKTNQKFQLHLYRIPLPRLLLIIATQADGLDEDTLKSMRDVFFPHVQNLADLRELGKAPWEGRRRRALETRPTVVANRANNILYANNAYMPYNARDNTAKSPAIGTSLGSGNFKLPLSPFEPTLDVWNTASRSSVARVKLKAPLTFKDRAKRALIDGELWMDYGTPDPHRFRQPPPDANTELDLAAEGAAFSKTLLSVKTGVNIIGIEEQPGKAYLEHNSILAALRSSYIRAAERELGYDSFGDPEVLILTEIATVTESDPTWDDWMFPLGKDRSRLKPPKFGDGYQIRSLKGMKSDREYFPPLSIPFVRITNGRVDANSSSDFTAVKETVTSQSVFAQLDDPAWQEFWKRHYAEALGRAKAQILLRYGLQSFGGNSQNYLLEMQDGVPNGRVVFRDMGDYALHDYVLWAMFGPKNDLPLRYDGRQLDQQEPLVQAWREKLNFPLLKFECDDLHQLIDKGGAISEFPTFTGYHRSTASGMSTFNPFCGSCDKGTAGTAAFVGHISPLWAYALPVSPLAYAKFKTNLTIDDWGKVFKIEMEWGIANAKAWMKYLEDALGKNFRIDWELLPLTDFLNAAADFAKSADVTNAKADRMYDPVAYTDPAHQPIWADIYEKMKTWEMYLGWQIETFLPLEEGQKALRDYLAKRAPKAKFKLIATDGADIALRRGNVKMEYRGRRWSEAADENGEIRIYEGVPEDYKLIVKADDGSEGSFEVKELLARNSKTADFGKLKITYG